MYLYIYIYVYANKKQIDTISFLDFFDRYK